MTTKNNSFEYLRISLIFVVTYLASTMAWWWQHRSTVFGGSIEVWFDYIALAWNIPGWFMVGMFDNSQAQLATRLTDILIPILSGLIWGLFALLVVKLSKIFGKYVHASDNSR